MDPVVRAALDDARYRLAEMYGDRLLRVILYGSQARGDAHLDSDVDVLVVLKEELDLFKELKKLNQILYEMLEKHGVYMVFQPFTEATYQQRQSPLLVNVHAEGIEL